MAERLIVKAEFEDGSAIVLRDLGEGALPFATHYRAVNGDYFYWGHYFETEQEGRADFDNRVLRNLKRVKAKGPL